MHKNSFKSVKSVLKNMSYVCVSHPLLAGNTSFLKFVLHFKFCAFSYIIHSYILILISDRSPRQHDAADMLISARSLHQHDAVDMFISDRSSRQHDAADMLISARSPRQHDATDILISARFPHQHDTADILISARKLQP